MKRTLHFTLLILLATGLFAQQITNVRLSPQKSSYKTLEFVTIYWDYTGLSIPSDAPVKITLWREGNSQNICKIAENVRITRGSTGYQWTIPATCINPHTGTREDLTQGNLWVRVRWQRHTPAVYGESPHFTIKKSSVDFTRTHDVSSDFSNLAKMPALIFKEFAPKDRNKGLYVVKWDYKNLAPDTKIRAELTKGNSIYCTIRANVPVSARQLGIRSGEFCGDGKPQPKPGDKYNIRLSVMDSPRLVSAKSREIMIPGLPDLVVCIQIPDHIFLTVETIKTWVIVKDVSTYPTPRPLGPFQVKYYIKDLGTKTYNFYFKNGSREAKKDRDIHFWTGWHEMKTVTAEVDPDNIIRESNETNNKIKYRINVRPWESGLPRIYYIKCSDGTSAFKNGKKGKWVWTK